MADKLKPVIVPEGIKAYITKVCDYFNLPAIIFQTSMRHVNKYGDSLYYSDKDPKCVAAGLISTVLEEGSIHGWYKGRHLTNKHLAECLGISAWSVSNHRQMYKRFLAKRGHKHSD